MNCKVVKMTVHAAERVVQWNITTDDVRRIIEHGEVIEDYPHDPRGHSCLMLGFVNDRPVHICVGVARAPDLCEIVTIYEPTLDRWHDDRRTRRKRL